MKQKICFNLFFKIYAKKLPLSRKTYIFVQSGSKFPQFDRFVFGAYRPKFSREPSDFLNIS